MRVYLSEVKDWDAELKAFGKRVKPSHPYDLESTDDVLWWVQIFFPIGWILRFLIGL